MKRKRIFEKILVSLLILSLSLSSVSVAAENDGADARTLTKESVSLSDGADTKTDSVEAPQDTIQEETSDAPPEENPEEDPEEDADNLGDPLETDPEEEDEDTPLEDPAPELEDPAETPGESPEAPTPSDTTQTDPSDAIFDDGQEDTSDQSAHTPDTTDEAQSPADPQTPSEDPEEVSEMTEEEAWEYEDSMPLEDFEALDEEEVGEIMLWNEASVFRMPRRARAAVSYSADWNFDIHYVNQDDNYEVEKDDDFSLKYQIEFRNTGGEDIDTGEVEIRIPRNLLEKRDGSWITEDQVAVPAEDSGRFGSTPFQYRIKGDELVFFNAKPIPAGTNSMWQVLYKVNAMEVTDGDTWTLTPSVRVGEDELDEGTCKEKTLRGTIDTYVQITSFTKTLYQETNKRYTPGLYTESQVKAYIGTDLPEPFSGEHFDDYHYVVWEMTVKGTATQPWKLNIQELPTIGGANGVPGYVVGYKDRSNASLGYDIPITVPAWEAGNLKDGFLKEEQTLTGVHTEKSWGSRFWVVTAYPVERVTLDGTNNLLRNQAIAVVDAVDEAGEDAVSAPQIKEWPYQNYVWKYDGDTIYIRKHYTNNESDKTYSGWLDVYRSASREGQDYGEFPFVTETSFYGYKWTHDVEEDGKVGTRREGNTFNLIATDDTMYASLDNEKKVWLGPEDYYFTEITVTATDQDVDIYEDQKVPGDPGTLKIYVMDGLDENGAVITNEAGAAMDDGDWNQICEETMPEGVSTLQKTFHLTDPELAAQPWRIKAEYVSGNYVTTCRISVKVRLRKDSPALAEVCKVGSTVSEVQLEDISGVLGEYLHEGEVVNTIYVSKADSKPGDTIEPDSGEDGGVTIDSSSALVNYTGYKVSKEKDLADLTEDLYGGLLCRTNDDKKLTNLTPRAEASKASTSTNDSDNDRVLVDYQLTAYNGWEVYGQDAIPWLTNTDQDLINPGHKDVVFYDLLPYGMTYDPTVAPVAGRITSLDSKRNYQTRPDLWVKSQVKVTVDPETDIETDYNGTGRTRIAFHISYEGADPSVYTSGMWMEGWGVSFRAYYEKKDLKVVQAGQNVCAFMAEDGSALIGKENIEVFPDDGASYPSDFSEADKALGQIREESGTGLCSVMYARNAATGEFVESAVSSFNKKVRADADQYGTFKDSAKVVPGGDYTYELTVAYDGSGSSEGGQKGIIVYDALETAGDPEADQQIQGTFRHVVTSGLKQLGLAPKVYYSDNAAAAQPKTAADLTKGNGWIPEEEWVETQVVRAVAVDLSKMADGSDFVLQKDQNITFQISMRLPADANEGDVVKNRASYYARPEQANEVKTFESNTTTVTVAPARKVEVIKMFADGLTVPASVQSSLFRFRLYEMEDGKKQYLGNQAYTLQDTDGNELESNIPHATAADGSFSLHAGEKAVFWYADIYKDDVEEDSRLNIYAEEVEEIFWKSSRNITDNSNAESGSRKILITNEYRPVLYVQKQLQGILEDEGHQEEAKLQEFTFRIERKDTAGTWIPMANEDYYYVDRTGLSGGIPGPDQTHGSTLEDCLGRTDEEGCFTIKKDDVVAVCFDSVGTMYRVSEVTEEVDGKDYAIAWGEDGQEQILPWICQTGAQTGTSSVSGSRATIVNAYRWKELYLTKKITHQEEEDYKKTKFTFQIRRQKADGTFAPLDPEETARITWQLTDDEAEPHALAADGKITAACGGRTIRITGLEAGATYQVTEILDQAVNYEPDQEQVTVTMPITGDRRSVTVTNDYLMRPLYVTKTVAYDPSDEEMAAKAKEASFQMFVVVVDQTGKDVLLTEKPYILMEQGKVVATGLTTDEDGTFSLKDGQTAVFKDAAKLGWSYAVTEIHPKDLEEAAKEPFRQVSPPVPEGQTMQAATGTVEGDQVEVTIVNGSNDSLYISKDYVYDPEDLAAQQYRKNSMLAQAGQTNQGVLNLLAQADQTNEEVLDVPSVEESSVQEPTGTLRKSEHAVKVSLKLNGRELELCEVSVVGADGRIYTDQWTVPGAEDTLEKGIYLLEPGTTVIIPSAILNEYRTEGGELSYELTELEDYRHRVEPFSYKTTPDDGGGGKRLETTIPKIIEINQKVPADDASVVGTVEKNPVASIVNEIVSHDIQSEAEKKMTWNSSEVPEGAKLVWRVEKKADGLWVPAADIPYAAFGCALEGADSGRILRTGSDGKIQMTKIKDQNPWVCFPEHEVWLNLNDGGAEGEYRLVEVMEESDPAWGMLVGYTMPLKREPDDATEVVGYTINHIFSQTAVEKHTADAASSAASADGTDALSSKAPRVNRAGDDAAGMGVSGQIRRDYNLAVGEKNAGMRDRLKVDTFYNSNVPKAVEIAKEMETDSNRLFTMVLKQVLLLKDDAEKTYASALNSVKPEDILMTEGRAGIPYTVYNTESGEKIREGKTGSGGTLQLYAGEYASLNLPEGTLWTLTEDQPATFEEPALKTGGAAENRVSIPGASGQTGNLALLYQTAAPEPELKVNITDPDVYLSDIRHNSLIEEGVPFVYGLDLAQHIRVFLEDKVLELSEVEITGDYTDPERLKALASSTDTEPVQMNYTISYTVPEREMVLTKDFTLTYRPPVPISVEVEVLKQVVEKEDIKQSGSTWWPTYSLDLIATDYIRVIATYEDGSSRELTSEEVKVDGEYTTSEKLEKLVNQDSYRKLDYTVSYVITGKTWTCPFTIYCAKSGQIGTYTIRQRYLYDLSGNPIDLYRGDSNHVLILPEIYKSSSGEGAEISRINWIFDLGGSESIVEELRIPAGVKIIGENALRNMPELKRIYIEQERGFVYYKNSNMSTQSSPPWGATSNPAIYWLDGNGGWVDSDGNPAPGPQ